MKGFSFFNYLTVMVILTVVFGVIYVTVQQSYRTAANDPQVQIARDIAAAIHLGRPVERFFKDTIDIARSLLPFEILYDAGGKPIRSSGYLDGKMIQLPPGVFDFARAHREHSVTWQPGSGIRIAMVIVSSGAGFVAAGRSLQEIEVREHDLITITFIGWALCIVLILIHAEVQFLRISKVKPLPESL
jgi:hypothetical protein